MKKLLFLSIFAFFALVSANVFGQAGMGATPSIGSKHQYWVNGTGIGSITSGKEGSTYTWWISDGTGNLTTPLAQTDFTATSDYNSAKVNQNGIELTWNPTSVNKTYYLVVKEDGVAPLCTNIKAFAIQPKNDFAVQFVLVDQNSSDADVSSFCPPNIALSANAATTSITYNYGEREYTFKLKSSGLYSAWSFANSITNSSSSVSSTTTEYQIGSATSWTPITSSVNVPANTTGTEVVKIRVTVNNGKSDDVKFDEGIVQRTIELALSGVVDGASNKAKITNNAGTPLSDSPKQTQTVNARPATTGIQSN